MVSGGGPAGPQAIRDRIGQAREHLEAAVENTLWDLGTLGQVKAREILSEISDELDEVEQLLADPDE